MAASSSGCGTSGRPPVRPLALCYASMTRLRPDARAEGGRIARRFGSHVEVAAPEGLAVAPGEAWTLTLTGLTHAPTNRTQGAMAAWIETEAGPVPAEAGDLRPPEGTPLGDGGPPPGPPDRGALPEAAEGARAEVVGRLTAPHPGVGSDNGGGAGAAGAAEARDAIDPGGDGGSPGPAAAAVTPAPSADAAAPSPATAGARPAATPSVCLLPWPAQIAVETGPAAPLHAETGRGAAALVAGLHRRLFPTAPAPLSLDPAPGSRAVRTMPDPTLPPGGYALEFAPAVTLAHADADGLRHGLVALAQMAHAARTDPRFGLPRAGRIADRPRFDWRGAHLDVARNMRAPGEVARLIDVLAWHRMSHLHLHLTDDEGWRLESRAFPALTEIGAVRGRGRPLPPQFADGPAGQSGFYTVEEIRALVAHGARHGVAIVPEIDAPGHATALLASVPGLRDPEERARSYHSVQGYPNNALNPGLPRTYEVLEAILGEVADLFPSPLLHLGGDEVPDGAWGASPAALALARAEGVEGAAALQGLFTRRAERIVGGLGRRMAGWDECAEGGVASGAVLFAWRSAARTAELLAAGRDVVATPGEAYYLDMTDREGWDAAGTSWAGAVTPEATYRFEAGAPPGGPAASSACRPCLWSEHLATRAHLAAMAHPRLSAVAEAAWTPPGAKSWPRFAALAPLMPHP